MKEIRLWLTVGMLAALLALGALVGEESFWILTVPWMTALPALALMLADVAGEFPRVNAASLLTAAGSLCVYAVGALGSGGLGRYLPYALLSAFFLAKSGMYPHGRARRTACTVSALALLLAALYAANPLGLDEEAAACLRGALELGVLPLLVSCALASTSRPLLVKSRVLAFFLMLAAFMLMTLSMGQLWFAGLIIYHPRAVEIDGAVKLTATLYRRQPLLLFALLELFVPAAYSYFLTARFQARNTSRKNNKV